MASDRRHRPRRSRVAGLPGGACWRDCPPWSWRAGCSGPATIRSGCGSRSRSSRPAPGSSAPRWCASGCSGRCRRSPICSPRSARATTRSAPAARAPEDGLGLALLEVNTLSDTLRTQRLGALEATALLRRVIEEIDVAVFAFDGNQRLRLVNRGGERLLGQPVGAPARPRGRAARAGGVPRRARPRAPSRRRSPAAAGDGRCAAVLFARTACPIDCWCCPI